MKKNEKHFFEQEDFGSAFNLAVLHSHWPQKVNVKREKGVFEDKSL